MDEFEHRFTAWSRPFMSGQRYRPLGPVAERSLPGRRPLGTKAPHASFEVGAFAAVLLNGFPWKELFHPRSVFGPRASALLAHELLDAEAMLLCQRVLCESGDDRVGDLAVASSQELRDYAGRPVWIPSHPDWPYEEDLQERSA